MNGKESRQISDEQYQQLKAVNNREEYQEPGQMPWRAGIDGIYSTYKRSSCPWENCRSGEFTNESTFDEPPYIMKKIDCLCHNVPK